MQASTSVWVAMLSSLWVGVAGLDTAAADSVLHFPYG